MGPPRPMQTAEGLAVCCGLLQTAVAHIFDKYFDHMGPVVSTTVLVELQLGVKLL
jgi:hypothetical protein